MRTTQLVLILLCAVLISCNKSDPAQAPNTKPLTLLPGGIYDPPPVRTFPSSPKVIQTWIDGLDDAKIRAHAWDIWQSVTTASGDQQNLPIWETWYSGHEIFDLGPQAKVTRSGVHDFQAPTQFFHHRLLNHNIPSDPAERPTSFNRYSRSLGETIWNKRLYKASTLDSANNYFNTQKTPIALRELSTSVDSVDALSFALKPVFQFISGKSATAVPYWAGVSPLSTNNMFTPEAHNWQQCVIVDPSGKMPVGSKQKMDCNGHVAEWPVVALSDFYSITITPEMAKQFSEFAETSGDDIGSGNQTDSAALAQMVQPGNIALLVAMHVTGKEIVNWTWQTFWWSPYPTLPPYGHDRPTSIPKPWNSYMMTTAYYMAMPASAPAGNVPLHAFNPYLETNLSFSYITETKDTVPWTGVFSNCMSCHRMAAYPNNQYIPDGYIDKANVYMFADKTKVDFLWSILRAH